MMQCLSESSRSVFGSSWIRFVHSEWARHQCDRYFHGAVEFIGMFEYLRREKEPLSRSGSSKLRGFISDKGEVVVLLKQFETLRAAWVMKYCRKRNQRGHTSSKIFNWYFLLAPSCYLRQKILYITDCCTIRSRPVVLRERDTYYRFFSKYFTCASETTEKYQNTNLKFKTADPAKWNLLYLFLSI